MTRAALLVLCSAAVAHADEPPKVGVELGEGISVTSDDGDSRMQIRARLQLRASQFSEDDGDAPNVTEFQARRIRLLVQGHAVKHFKYYLQLGFSNLDTEPDLRSPVRDAYITFAKWRDLNIRGGQMKVPFGRQRVISSSALQMPDRSIVVGELNLDRDVGVQLLSDDLLGLGGRLAYNVGVFHGDGRNRLATTPGVLLVGRVAVRPFGGFDDFVEGDFKRSKSPKLALAIGAAHNANTNRPRSTLATPYEFARFDYTHATADAIFKLMGFTAQAEIIYRKASEDFVEDPMTMERELARNAWGWYAQTGYLVTDHVEAVARFGEIRPLGESDPALAARQREWGGGLSYYWQEHDLKLQGDYFYLDPQTGDGRHQARVQMQIYF